MERKVELLLVDDHALFRRGLASILSNYERFEIVGQACNGEEAVEMGRCLSPDVILMDLKMPGCDGVDATRLLREAGFSKSIVVLTVSEDEDDLFKALRYGADGYILKDTEVEELVASIIHAAKSETVISPVMAKKLLNELNISDYKENGTTPAELDTLTKREKEVLQLVAGGSTNKEIAVNLFLTENTVKSHLRSIMGKLNMKRRHAIVTYAIKKGFISLSNTNDTECT